MYDYGDVLSVLMSVGLVLVLVMLIAAVLTVVGKWKVLDKLDKRPWAALIPFFSDYEMCIGVGAPQWLAFAYPVVSVVGTAISLAADADVLVSLCNIATFVFLCMMCHYTSKRFGKGVGWTIGLALLGPVFWPVLGLGSSTPDAQAE